MDKIKKKIKARRMVKRRKRKIIRKKTKLQPKCIHIMLKLV